jgi:hypothetical protein
VIGGHGVRLIPRDTLARIWQLAALAGGVGVRVGPAQYPRLDRLRNECALVLDLPEVPKLFVARSTTANAYTIGIGRPVRQGGQRLIALARDTRRRLARRTGNLGSTTVTTGALVS